MDANAQAAKLFARIMAPLVLGGTARPIRALSDRFSDRTLVLRPPLDPDLVARVVAARVRRARTLVPVDSVPDATGAEWRLAAATNDLLEATNPVFDAPLRRRRAARILDAAAQSVGAVPPAENLGEAIARHTWFARFFDVQRTDTTVSWWTGSRMFLGRPVPARLVAWPELRRVHVERASVALLDLRPLAVDRGLLAGAIEELLARTPVTDLATCTRRSPAFRWRETTLGLLAPLGGLRVATRAVGRLVDADADESLGRATRPWIKTAGRDRIELVLSLLAERAVERAMVMPVDAVRPSITADGTFARALGAIAAHREIVARVRVPPPACRDKLLATLAATAARSPEAAAALRT
jgi:hypothetical protein